ncbi:spore germination protein, partial [Paenibacillus sp. TAF58]
PKRPALLHTPNDTRLGMKTKKMKHAPSNTLDPLKVGNTRRDVTDGVSSPSNDDSSGDHSN